MYYNTFDEGYLSETDKHQIKCWLKTDYKLRELELEHAKEIIDNYFEKNELAKELIKSGMPGEAAIIIPQMSVEEFNEYQMIVALVNKISKWNGFVLGAIDAVPFATEAIDWCDRIAIEGVGKQIVEDATFSNTMENVKCQNPIAYGSGYAASVIAQINILRGLKGGEAVESGTSTLAQYGDDFGKMGTYVENPNIKVDWTQYAEHAAERMQQRGMTQEIVNNIVENGKVLSQNNGNKFAYITQEGVAIVSKEGKLITAWSSADFDSSMLEIISKLFGE